MVNDPSEQLCKKGNRQRVAVAGPEFVRFESDTVAEGPILTTMSDEKELEIDEILVLDILEQINGLSKKGRARLMELLYK